MRERLARCHRALTLNKSEGLPCRPTNLRLAWNTPYLFSATLRVAPLERTPMMPLMKQSRLGAIAHRDRDTLQHRRFGPCFRLGHPIHSQKPCQIVARTIHPANAKPIPAATPIAIVSHSLIGPPRTPTRKAPREPRARGGFSAH